MFWKCSLCSDLALFADSRPWWPAPVCLLIGIHKLIFYSDHVAELCGVRSLGCLLKNLCLLLVRVAALKGVHSASGRPSTLLCPPGSREQVLRHHHRPCFLLSEARWSGTPSGPASPLWLLRSAMARLLGVAAGGHCPWTASVCAAGPGSAPAQASVSVCPATR